MEKHTSVCPQSCINSILKRREKKLWIWTKNVKYKFSIKLHVVATSDQDSQSDFKRTCNAASHSSLPCSGASADQDKSSLPSSLFLQFAEQFKEVKEAARLAREKSQERFELANTALSIAAPEVTYFLCFLCLTSSEYFTAGKWKLGLLPCSQNNQSWKCF